MITNTLFQDATIKFHFQKIQPYVLLGQPVYLISGKSTKALIIYVRGPNEAIDLDLVLTGKSINGNMATLNWNRQYIVKRIPTKDTTLEVTLSKPGKFLNIRQISDSSAQKLKIGNEIDFDNTVPS